jgi:hypothetical protein
MGERKQIKLGLIGFGEVGSTLGKGGRALGRYRQLRQSLPSMVHSRT